jgi:uncharacterized protein YbjQ (UPF0145 family)
MSSSDHASLPLFTTHQVAGHRVVRSLGLAVGNTIRARHVGHDIMAAFTTMVGGEITEYTKMMAESREQALDRLREDAALQGANAIVGLQITTSMILQGAAEIRAYGTAVVIERE